MLRNSQIVVMLGCAVSLLGGCAGVSGPAVVRPAFETVPVRTKGDAADDAAVWVHPTRPERSLIIGTDKQRGLIAYDLDGKAVHEAPGRINNVDVVRGFESGGRKIDLALGSDRDGNRIAVFAIEPEGEGLRNIAARDIKVDGGSVYGLCAMRSARTSEVFVFVTTTDDEVQQWRLMARGERVDAELVRRFSVGGHAEGMVADAQTNALFVAEEDVGIWKYEAEPAWLASGKREGHEEMSASEAGARSMVGLVGRDGLAADVEGLTIYRDVEGEGWLLASNQGDSTFAVFEVEPPHGMVFSFTVGENGDIDAVSGTDGIEACAGPLGARFPRGILVVQDDDNEGAPQNFKVIAWERIAGAAPR